MRKLLFTLVLLALVFLPVTQAIGAEIWTIADRALDTTGWVSDTFLNQFSDKSAASGLPIYLFVIDEEDMRPDRYADEVAMKILDGLFGSQYAAGNLTPKTNFILIIIAPYVDESSDMWELAVPNVYSGGIYAKITSTTFSGHSENAAVELGNYLDDRTIQIGWEKATLELIDEIVSVWKEISTAPSQNNAQPPVQQPAAQAPVIVEKNPVDYSGVLKFFLWMVIGTLVIVGFAVLYLWNKKERDAISAARKKAELERTGAVNLISRWDGTLAKVNETLEFLSITVAANALTSIRSQLSNIQDAAVQPTIAWDKYDQQWGDNLTVSAYEEIGRRFNHEVVTPMNRAHEQLEKLLQEMQNLERMVQQAEPEISVANGAIDEAEFALKTANETGYQVAGAARLIEEAESVVSQAIRAKGVMDYPRCIELANRAEELAEKAKSEAVGIIQRVQSLHELAGHLRNDDDVLTQLILEARQARHVLGSQFAASTWEELADNPDRAEKNRAHAAGLIQSATNLLSEQNWDETEVQLHEAEAAQEHAENLCESLTNRLQDLKVAQAGIVALMVEAERSVKAAWEYVVDNDPRVPESAEVSLREADELLIVVRDEVEKERPNYLGISEMVRKADKLADIVLSDAQSLVDQIDRAERTVAVEIAEAEKAVKAADEYEDDHRADVGRDARALLDEAEASLAKGKQHLDNAAATEDSVKLEHLRQAAKLADEAEQKAKSAKEKAKADVVEANRPVSTWSGGSDDTNVVVYTPTYHTPSQSPSRTNPSRSTQRSTPSYTPPASRSTSRSSSSPSISSSRSTSRSTPSSKSISSSRSTSRSSRSSRR